MIENAEICSEGSQLEKGKHEPTPRGPCGGEYIHSRTGCVTMPRTAFSRQYIHGSHVYPQYLNVELGIPFKPIISTCKDTRHCTDEYTLPATDSAGRRHCSYARVHTHCMNRDTRRQCKKIISGVDGPSIYVNTSRTLLTIDSSGVADMAFAPIQSSSSETMLEERDLSLKLHNFWNPLGFALLCYAKRYSKLELIVFNVTIFKINHSQCHKPYMCGGIKSQSVPVVWYLS